MPSCLSYCFAGRRSQQIIQLFPFLWSNLPVFSFPDSIQSQIHDPNPLQLLYFIPQILAHPADLSIQSLCQNNPKTAFSCLLHLAGSGHCIQNRYSSAHSADKIFIQRFIYYNKVLFLMVVACTHDLIHQISLISQKKKSLGFFVQSAYRINTQRIFQIVRDGYLLALLLCTAYNSSWFVKKKQYFLFIFMNRYVIYADFIFRQYFLTADGLLAVHCDSSFLDHPVCLSPGAHTCFA